MIKISFKEIIILLILFLNLKTITKSGFYLSIDAVKNFNIVSMHGGFAIIKDFIDMTLCH